MFSVTNVTKTRKTDRNLFFLTLRGSAAREEAIANYRQAVLVAIKDVETSLTSATTATELTRQRYDRGMVSYLELLDADRTRLQVELRYVQVTAQQHIASVRLIKALGGGWQENDAAPRPERASPSPVR